MHEFWFERHYKVWRNDKVSICHVRAKDAFSAFDEVRRAHGGPDVTDFILVGSTLRLRGKP